MGAWNFSYDSLNRLATSQNTATMPTSSQYAGNYACWSYDSFGNRLSQSMSTTSCTNNPPLMSWANYNASNQFTNTSQALGGVQYDPSGDVTNDGQNQYLYDGEGRICAVKSEPVGSTYTMTGYLYDADGTRVAKGRISVWSCDPGVNGFQTTNDYILGPGGEQVTAMGVDTTAGSSATTLAWQHTNVYAAGSLIATYDNDGLHFYFNDPLGTRRAQTNFEGVLEQTCSSLPYGDGLSCSDGNLTAPTEHHFTGKERDAESGNDYFGARYYASYMGHWMSPDSVGDGLDPVPVPWAKFKNPQSMNLYSYVLNNPLTNTDPDGNDCIVQTRTGYNTETVSRSSGNCDKVTVGDGQTKNYIDGVVDMSTLKTSGPGQISFDFTPYSGGAGVANLNWAPVPESTNLAYYWGNNPQGYHTIGTASATIGSVKGFVAWYVASAAGAVCVLFCAEAAVALPHVAVDLEAKVMVYLESQGIPATAKAAIALKVMS
jgi:RHS repeat-associated protein